MPSFKGTIKRIFVNPAYCCLTVKPTSGNDKLFLLWSYPTQEDNAKNRLTHGAYLSLARDAYTYNKTVTLSHQQNSSIVDSITIDI
jgi:hypothetical protein